MNANELRGKIVSNGMTVEKFCDKAGFARSTFDRKLSEKCEFTREEIAIIISVLNLTDTDIRNIFFDDVVS